MTSSKDEEKRVKRDAEDLLLNDDDDDDDEAERNKRLPRLGSRAPLPRLGLLRSADKRLPRMGRQRRLRGVGIRLQRIDNRVSVHSVDNHKRRLSLWVDNDVCRDWACEEHRSSNDYHGSASDCQGLAETKMKKRKKSGTVRCGTRHLEWDSTVMDSTHNDDKRLPRLGRLVYKRLPRLGLRSIGYYVKDDDDDDETRASPFPRVGQRAAPVPRLGDRASPFPRLGKRASPFPRLGERASPFPRLGRSYEADDDMAKEHRTL